MEPYGHSFMTCTATSHYHMRNIKGENMADVLSTTLFLNAFNQLSSSPNKCPYDLEVISKLIFSVYSQAPTRRTSVLRIGSMGPNKHCPHPADQDTSSKLDFYTISYISLRNVLEQKITNSSIKFKKTLKSFHSTQFCK